MWMLPLFMLTLAARGPQPMLEEPLVVVVDAGHGGENPGCTGFDGHTLEKDVALALAHHVAGAIARDLPHAQVRLTRDDDTTRTLAGRVAEANDLGADLFLSVHANASPAHDQRGFETYVLDAASSTADAAWTARRENAGAAADEARPVSEVTLMLRQLEQAAHRDVALRFAGAVQRHQASRFPERLDRGVRQAPFDVLTGANMPAVLFEVGFLDHPLEGAWLLRDDAQREIADGIADAVVEYDRARRQRSSFHVRG